MTQELTARSIADHAESLRRGEYSAAELTRAYLERIEAQDKALHCYLTVTPDLALSAAAESDKRRAAGESRGALDGIPFALKDNICTAGIPTTCASRMLEGYRPPYNAHVTERLLAQGAVLLGKLNMDEFAMGSTTETSAMGLTRNPLDMTRTPGGSSGGSAAAVAAGLAAFTLGSDTGGSVRQPAAFCGAVGMKPTWGCVSRYGLIAFAPSLEQIGPLTRTVGDNALVLSALAGHDPKDATSDSAPRPDYTVAPGSDLRGLRIGVARQSFSEAVSPDVRAAMARAVEALRSLGAETVEVSLPCPDAALAAYYVLSAAEASSNLARFDGVRYGHRTEAYDTVEELYCRSRTEGFGAEVKRRILLGTFALSAGFSEQYYQKAQGIRALVRAELARILAECDLMLLPTAPTVAFPLGQKRNDPTELYAGDLFSVPANVAGLPALSLPFGKGEGGMPVGLQLMGAPHGEPLLYRVGGALESLEGGARV